MPNKTIKIVTQDLTEISALIIESKIESPKAIIQFHSGTVTIKEYYLKLGQHLSENGYTVVLFDYRGVGKSRPKKLTNFKANIVDWGKKDAEAVTQWISKTYPNKAIHLLAHSMGGQIYGLMKSWNLFDKIIFLTTSSGNYNKFEPISYRLKVKWPTILIFPIALKIWGYIPGFLGLGQDWPKGIANDWARNNKLNGLMSNYLESKTDKSYYKEIDKKIIAWYFPDDNMSTPETITELPLSYPEAKITVRSISPKEVGLKRIGHFGIFKTSAKEKLWPLLLQTMEGKS